MNNTRRAREFAELAAAFSDLTAHLNQPSLHNRVLEEAGVSLDAALARLLIGIRRHGVVGVVELADLAGRDHTTVSRQVAKLVELGLVERSASEADRRVSRATITARGNRVAGMISDAHTRLVMPAFEGWSEKDFADLRRMMRRMADDVAKLREPVETM